MKNLSPVLIHVPHSSTFIPSDELQYFVTENLKREIICMTDHYCDDLFNCQHEMVRFPLSRLICDVERFRDDSLELMSQKGMGAVYTKCSDGSLLKSIPDAHRDFILKNYYDDHHLQLEAAVRLRLEQFGKCILIDGHSFPATPLPYEFDQNQERSDICIGTDEYHTPDYLSQTLINEFRKKGYSVSLNTPFSGSMVPNAFYRQEKKVESVMIEINRRLYMDCNANKSQDYLKIRRDICEVIDKL